MSYLKTELWPNGEEFTPVKIYQCDGCKTVLPESYPQVALATGQRFCSNCAFLNGLINEHEFLDNSGFGTNECHADVRNGAVVVWLGNRAPWLKNPQDVRRSSAYRRWHDTILKRDEYTCQICGQVGGRLNVHHIKPFAKYPKLRLELSNGVTLCERCHRNIHRKKESSNDERGISN